MCYGELAEMGKAMILDVAPHRAIQELERDLGLAPETIAIALGVEKRRVILWRDEGHMPQTRARDALAELYDIHERALRLFSPEDARVWMHSPSRYLGTFSPEQAIRAGEVGRVSEALEAIETGAFV